MWRCSEERNCDPVREMHRFTEGREKVAALLENETEWIIILLQITQVNPDRTTMSWMSQRRQGRPVPSALIQRFLTHFLSNLKLRL